LRYCVCVGADTADTGPARWVTLRARWVTLRARWVTIRACWETLRARMVTLRARWVTLRARWVTLRARWVTLRARPPPSEPSHLCEAAVAPSPYPTSTSPSPKRPPLPQTAPRNSKLEVCAARSPAHHHDEARCGAPPRVNDVLGGGLTPWGVRGSRRGGGGTGKASRGDCTRARWRARGAIPRARHSVVSRKAFVSSPTTRASRRKGGAWFTPTRVHQLGALCVDAELAGAPHAASGIPRW
jgi:hypothetical protein